MTLMARWSGVCPECGEKWQPGDLIQRNPASTLLWDKDGWQHAVCPDPLATEHPVCPACYIAHPKHIECEEW